MISSLVRKFGQAVVSVTILYYAKEVRDLTLGLGKYDKSKYPGNQNYIPEIKFKSGAWKVITEKKLRSLYGNHPGYLQASQTPYHGQHRNHKRRW